MQSAFTLFKNSTYAKNAQLKYHNTPFSYIIDAAQVKDKDAIFYLVLRSLKAIAASFLKFYVRGRMINDMEEKSGDYFNEFLAVLLEQTEEEKGPFFTFKADTFTPEQQSDDEFLINKFRYYMYGYSSRIAIKMYKEEEKPEELAMEYGSEDDNNEEIKPVEVEELASKEKTAEDVITDDIFLDNEEFMSYLKQKKPVWYKMLMLIKKYSSYGKKMPQMVSKAMGWTTANGAGAKNRSMPSAFFYNKKAIGLAYKKFMDAGGDISAMSKRAKRGRKKK
jgi:hypothetical protein